jgi:CTP synthase
MTQKFLFITGGVVSSLGKGLTSAGIGLILESQGLKISMLKLDPYLNVDPGTMNPFEHGEVYVTDDGAETDLDLGHYYRMTNAELSKASNTTSGQIYDTVIRRERKGEYLGKTVQVIPHVTDEIKARIRQVAEDPSNPDVILVEVGGTVGDIESRPFMEAIRQFCHERQGQCLNIHLTYVPYVKAAQELKTKPTQHSVQLLREIGIIPDIILCRSEQPLQKEIKDKISLFCSVRPDCVFDVPDVESIYSIPLLFKSQGLDVKIAQLLHLNTQPADLREWEDLLKLINHPKHTVTIAIVGKYLQYKDAYKSLFEALQHASIHTQTKIVYQFIDSDKLTTTEELKHCDGILVPGGFGQRGFEGKILATEYARLSHLPFFGICLGMQVMVVEYTRHVLGYTEANSTEMNLFTPHPVIAMLSELSQTENIGGTMRKGAFTCALLDGSKAALAYGSTEISERHRHRYEFNKAYEEELVKQGLTITGKDPKRNLCEVVEVAGHPWMVGVQFHPEFKSKPLIPHPLFKAFIEACLKHKQAQG